MGRRILVTSAKIILTALALVLCLFGDHWVSQSGSFVGAFLREIQAALRDPEIQWMACLCLGIYFIIFSLLRCRKTGRNFWNTGNPGFWLAGTILIGAFAYTFDYPASAQSTNALTLLAGATLGQGLALCPEDNAHKNKNWIYLIIVTLLLLLSLGSLELMNPGSVQYQYREQSRWVGAWDNPNIYGLLMGTGAILAFGLLVHSLMSKVQGQMQKGRNWKLKGQGKIVVMLLCLFAAILMGRGLLHSYSRGAWLAAICGLAYLVNRIFSFQLSTFSQWLRRNTPSLAIIVLSCVVLAFWQFQHTEHKYVATRRALSVANVNDFSWRNRISAWEGALQIMAERPTLGAGWNQPESLYEYYYLLPKMEESGTIGLNDYLILGATLGVPALICFVTYIWLNLTRSGFRVPPLGGPTPKPCERGTPNEDCGQTSGSHLGLLTSDFLPLVCRAGVVVLLVSFWFDGGLFKLATASTFWILLELGSDELHKGAAKQTNEVP